MLYEKTDILFTYMLNELNQLKDDKSRTITYWANVKSLLNTIYKIKFPKKRIPRRRDIILDALEKEGIVNKNLRCDIDKLAQIRVLYGHEDSKSMMSKEIKKRIQNKVEKTYYAKTRSSEKNFPKYSTDRKLGLVCGAIFSNLTLEYKKLVKPELFDKSKYDIKINMFQY